VSAMQSDEVVAIELKREKFFGGSGQMLLPCPKTIGKLIDGVPAGQLITTDVLKKTLAAQFSVRGVCPVTFRNSLVALAGSDVPYWRIARFSDQAERLHSEGRVVETDGKAPKVRLQKNNSK
jgi:hypothetical protein